MNIRKKIEKLARQVFNYFKKNTFILFMIAVCLTFLVLSDPITGVFISVLIFILLILVDYDEYKKLNSKISCLSIIIGIIFIILSLFLDSIVMRFTDINLAPTFGQRDLILYLFGAIILFYGLSNLKKFLIPLGFPISFMAIFFIRRNTFIGDTIHSYFANFVVSVTVDFLNMLNYEASNIGNTLKLASDHGAQSFFIGGGCSGFESVIFFSVLGAFLLLKIKAERWKKVLIITVGAVGAFFLNIVRVILLCLVYYWYGIGPMVTFHTNAGNLMFIGWVGFIWWISFKYIFKEGTSKDAFPK